MTRETQPTEAQARLLMTPDQFAEWKRDRDARAAFWKNAISQQPADPEGTNAQLLANALSRAEIAENDLRAEILHSGKMRERAEAAEARIAALEKALGEAREESDVALMFAQVDLEAALTIIEAIQGEGSAQGIRQTLERIAKARALVEGKTDD